MRADGAGGSGTSPVRLEGDSRLSDADFPVVRRLPPFVGTVPRKPTSGPPGHDERPVGGRYRLFTVDGWMRRRHREHDAKAHGDDQRERQPEQRNLREHATLPERKHRPGQQHEIADDVQAHERHATSSLALRGGPRLDAAKEGPL